MSDETNPKGAGRPRIPKWDEMHDLAKLLKALEIAERNMASGKWKALPRDWKFVIEMHREALTNKYPDYYKPVAPIKSKNVDTDDIEESEKPEIESPLSPLVTPAPVEKEEIITFPGGWPGEDKEKK
jgi:hypothetical protein